MSKAIPNPMYGNEEKGQIWGFTDSLSYAPGETVNFHISCKTPLYSMEIARIGATREVVWSQAELKGKYYDIPANAHEAGCDWPVGYTIEIPANWRSGYYQVMFYTDDSEDRWSKSEHFFVVRSAVPGKDTRMVFVLSTNTYHAYNSWGGGNLYSSKKYSYSHLERGHRVAVKRPFEPGLLTKFPGAPRISFPTDEMLGPMQQQGRPYRQYSVENEVDYWTRAAGFTDRWEGIFAKFIEEHGFEADYITQNDLNIHEGILEPYNVFLSIGHDEYWTWKEREVLEDWIEQGGKLAKFSGNSLFWQVRYEDDGDTMVCYKYDTLDKDPVMGTADEKYLTTMWSSTLLRKPENTVTGLSFTRGGYARNGMSAPRGSGGYTIYRPSHWAFSQTGLEYGDVLGAKEAIVGYENDGCAFTMKDGLPYPTGEDGSPTDMEILAMSPVSLGEPLDRGYTDLLTGEEDLDHCTIAVFGQSTKELRDRLRHGQAMIVYFDKGKGQVFNSGTVEWAYGLTGGNPFVEQITLNVLRKFSE
jgi:hypothetical protein